MSTIAFGSTFSFLTSATPSTGWVIAYDTDGILKQKDSSGVITPIGVGASGSGTFSISQVLAVGNNTQTRSIIMGTSTTIASSNGGGKIELDRLGATNSILISSDNSSLSESYIILKNDSAKFSFNSSNQMIDLDSGFNQVSIYNNNAGSVALGVDTGSLIYGQLDEIKISYNVSSTASTGDYDKQAVLIGTRNSKILPGVVNTVVLGGQNFTASNSDSIYVPNIYLQNQKSIRSTNSNEVFYLSDINGYTLLDRNSGNLDNSWLLMATDYNSSYQAYVEIGVNSDSGYGNDSQINIYNSKGPSYSYQAYSNITVGKNILRLASQDVDGSLDTVRIDLITGNSITVDGSTSSFKGIEYNDDFSPNFVTHSLVDKQYVDSQFTGFTLDVVLAAGNNSETYDIVMGTATLIKSAQGGGQIELDRSGNTDEILISTDNGASGESYLSMTPTDFEIQSGSSLSLIGNDITATSGDSEGIKYPSDYSATFVTHSLVDKNYVDSGTSSIWSAIDSINFEYVSEIITGTGLSGGGTYGTVNIDLNIGNGLEFNSNNVYLGGTLSQNTSIDGNLFDFSIFGTNNIELGVSGSNSLKLRNTNGIYDTVVQLDADPSFGFYASSQFAGGTYSYFSVNENQIRMLVVDGTSFTQNSIEINTTPQAINDGSLNNNMIIKDGLFKGISYYDDYSSNFTTYSLVSKGYVDQITHHVDNGLTQSLGNIGLGGSLNRPVIIDGYGYNFYLLDIGRFSLTASTYIENQVYSISTNTSRQFNDGDSYFTRVDDVYGTSSRISLNPGSIEVINSDGASNLGFRLYSQDQVVGDGSPDNRFVAKDDFNSKGIVYAGDYTSNFTTYSLVTKGYVDSNLIRKYTEIRSFTASVTENIVHNLNTDEIIVQTYDSSGNMFIPGTVHINGVNSVDITLSNNLTSIKIVIIG